MGNEERGDRTPVAKRTHIKELDGLRGIAALAVFFHHLSFTSIDPSQWNQGIVSLYNLSRYGLYGVDLFFVLSGYLITSILLQDRGSKTYYHDFYWKRALRILPLYIFSLLAVWIWIRGSTGGVIVSALFLANFASVFHVNLEGPYWTLAIEEQFYLVWPQFVRRLRLEQLQKLALAIAIGEPILRLIATAFHHYNFIFTFFRCDGLALGALLACQLHRKKLQPAARNNVWKKLSVLPVFAIACVFLAITQRWMESPRFYMQGTALFLSAITLCFYSLIRISVENSGSRYLAILRSSVLVFFGEISYCMYMSHAYVMRMFDDWRGPLQAGNTSQYAVRVATVLAATVLICIASRYFLELPFMSLRKYVLRKPAPEICVVAGT